MKRIFGVLMVAVVVVSGAAWFVHRAKVRALRSGGVSVRDRNGGKTRLTTAATATGNQAAQIGSQNGPPTVANLSQAGNSQTAATAQSGQLALPTSDSIRRNPPNGTVFAGAGKYQLYRQGDITWRLDTDNGGACILFATEAQWRRSLVYNHGCGAT